MASAEEELPKRPRSQWYTNATKYQPSWYTNAILLIGEKVKTGSTARIPIIKVSKLQIIDMKL